MLRRRRKAATGVIHGRAEGPLPSKRHHPGRSRGICQGAYVQPSPLPRDEVEMLSYDIWGRWDSLGPVASMASMTLWS